MVQARNTKMQTWIGYRVRVAIQDQRMLTGTFMAFDQHMNVILSECEEFRRLKKSDTGNKNATFREIKRELGLVMLRGNQIVTMTIESPPLNTNQAGSAAISAPALSAPGGIPGGPGQGPMAVAGRGRGMPQGLM